MRQNSSGPQAQAPESYSEGLSATVWTSSQAQAYDEARPRRLPSWPGSTLWCLKSTLTSSLFSVPPTPHRPLNLTSAFLSPVLWVTADQRLLGLLWF